MPDLQAKLALPNTRKLIATHLDVFELKEQVLGTVPVKEVVTIDEAVKEASLIANKPSTNAVLKKGYIFIMVTLNYIKMSVFVSLRITSDKQQFQSGGYC